MTDTDRNETDDGEETDRETTDSETDAEPTEGVDAPDEASEDGREDTSEDTSEDSQYNTSEGTDTGDEPDEDASTDADEGARDDTSEDTSTEPADEESADEEAADARDESPPIDASSAVAVTGATSEEEAALRRARAVSRLLDEAVRVPGTDFRVGVDPILGILPGAGDAVAAGLSLYPVVEAYRLDAPAGTLAKMLALVAVDAVVGSVPIVGPLFDAVWKANVWNVRALERHVQAD